MKGNKKCMENGRVLIEGKCFTIDILSVTRTHLANERTLLAYLSAFLGVVVTGVALIKFTSDSFFLMLGCILLVLSIAIPIIGICRFIRIRKLIKEKICISPNYCSDEDNDE